MKQIILTTMLFMFSKQYVYGNYLNLYGIPEIAEENSVFRLRCRRPGGGLFYSKATFRRNGTDVATVKWGGFWSQSSCKLSVHNGESGYGCESSTRTKTLVIRHINKSRDSNSVWFCNNDHGWSNQYILPVKMDPPQCVLTTSINYNKSDDPEAGDQGDGNQLVLSEGDDLYLNCSASVVSGNHTDNEITYQWKIYGVKDEIYNGSDYGISNITRLDGAMYICTTSIGSYCTSSNVTYIQIQYHLSLNVTVNDTSEAIELICRVVDGYPTNFTMNNWRHYIDGQFVREIEGVTTEDRTALVLNNNILNAGTYVCNASNGIKDFKGSVYQTDETYINIEAPPLALDDGQVIEVSEQSDVQIKATFIIGGDAYNTTWYIQQQNSSNMTEISVDTNSENGIRPINIYGTVINKNVTIISGSVTISKMVDLNVTVTVCTQYGCTDSYKHVAVSSTSLISSNDELPVNVPVIAGGVVGAVVVIGLVILIIVLVRRRPTNENLNSESTRQNAPSSVKYKNPMYEQGQDDKTLDELYGNKQVIQNKQQMKRQQNMEILENELYISADDDPTPDKVDHTDNNQMEIMENELYVSGDDETTNCYVNQEVVTNNTMEIMENEMYIPAEIDTRVF